MIRTRPSALQDRCRLVCLLTELSASKLSVAEYNLAERLGHMVGVSGSMILARGITSLPLKEAVSQDSNIQDSNIADAQQYLLDRRARAIRSIQDSFLMNQGDAPTRVPSVAAGIRPEALKTFEPYQRFYVTHQMELSVLAKELRMKVRSLVSGVSVELHQLAILDQTLEESLDSSTRKLFSVIPKLLGHRFKDMTSRDAQVQSSRSGSEELTWALPFHNDMREMLLAELDVRLQPVFGLFEALNEHTD